MAASSKTSIRIWNGAVYVTLKPGRFVRWRGRVFYFNRFTRRGKLELVCNNKALILRPRSMPIWPVGALEALAHEAPD